MLTNRWLELALTVLCACLASSGLWAFIQHLADRKDSKTKLLIGIAHDRIVYLGTTYIRRGWISHEEYENLNDYLFVPYQACGGNGSATRVMEQVRTLPFNAPHAVKEGSK